MVIEDGIIEDRLLGRFRRTGEKRPPKQGEYYFCERIIGVACATKETQESKWPKEILERERAHE